MSDYLNLILEENPTNKQFLVIDIRYYKLLD